MAMSTPDLIFLGNLLVDDIVLRDGRALLAEPGGAVLHAALAACLWGARPGIVSVAGGDYPQTALDTLAARGAALDGVRRLPRSGGRAWLLYEPAVRRVIHHLDCPSHEAISPTTADIPAAFRDAAFVHLSPMPLGRQAELARDLAGAASFVSLDPYELLRDDNLAAWRDVFASIDAFFPSEDELRFTGGHEQVLRDLAGERLRYVALKRAADGGRLLDLHGDASPAWQSRAAKVVDATGAGDAFAGGFLAGLATHGDVARSLAQGIVSASFAIEDWGARGLVAATPAAARERLAAWFNTVPEPHANPA
jgi:sugar/nucleoside kinase (ribokinase family)